MVISSSQSLGDTYTPLPNFFSGCLYVSIRQALVLGGPWEAPWLLAISFIRSPAVSCQGLSLIGLRRQGWQGTACGYRIPAVASVLSGVPDHWKLEGTFDLILAVVSVYSFVCL